MKGLKLIDDVTTPYPVNRIFSLTEKGRKVALKLKEIEDVSEGKDIAVF